MGKTEKAFLNVGIDEGDRDCLRILWPDDPNDVRSEEHLSFL